MIDVDDVYKTVLFILNKEQRGYMTPAEFNKVADQVQLEILGKYFEDMNMLSRAPQPTNEYANRIKDLKEKIALLETSTILNYSTTAQLPSNLFRLGALEYRTPIGEVYEIEKKSISEFNLINRSKLTQPSLEYPVYTQSENTLNISPGATSGDLIINYIKKPEDIKWNYSLGTQGQYIYQSTGSQDFEISSEDRSEVIIRILLYAGVIIRDPSIVQTATQMSMAEDVNEKS